MTVMKYYKYIRRSSRQGFSKGGGSQKGPPSILINILQQFIFLIARLRLIPYKLSTYVLKV